MREKRRISYLHNEFLFAQKTISGQNFEEKNLHNCDEEIIDESLLVLPKSSWRNRREEFPSFHNWELGLNTSDEYADELASKEEAAKRKGPYSAVNCDGVCVCVCEREREREREREA